MATSRRPPKKRTTARKPARAKKPGGTRTAAGVKRAARAKKAAPVKQARAKKAAPAKKPAGSKPPARATQLQQELTRTRRDLEIRTAELEAAQARFTELEQRLRRIHESRPYRIAWEAWRIRAKARAPFSRNRREAPALPGPEQDGSADDRLPDGPDEVLYAAGYTEVSDTATDERRDRQGRSLCSRRADFEQEYHGSRGVRAVDPGQTGPLRPVLLLGGLSEAQLDKALRTLNGSSPAEREPLVITDCDALRMLDASGYLYEYVPPREDWEQRLGRDERGYDEFLRRRLASIAGMYELTDLPTRGSSRRLDPRPVHLQQRDRDGSSDPLDGHRPPAAPGADADRCSPCPRACRRPAGRASSPSTSPQARYPASMTVLEPGTGGARVGSDRRARARGGRLRRNLPLRRPADRAPAHPDPAWVWIRRAMWRPDTGAQPTRVLRHLRRDRRTG